MSYADAVLAMLLSILGSLGLSYVIHRLIPVDTRLRHQDVGVAVFLQLGVLFAVLLAFVFSEAYSEYGEAQRAIDLECSGLHAAAMLESSLPPSQARILLDQEMRYIQNVVQDDWPSMRIHHQGGDKAPIAITQLIQEVARLPMNDPVDAPVKAELLSLLTTAHSNREIRLYQAGNGLPSVLWVVLIGFAIVLMIFVAFSPVEQYLSLAIFGMTFTACATAIMVLVRLLDYPFEGAIAISPEDFLATMNKVATLLRAV